MKLHVTSDAHAHVSVGHVSYRRYQMAEHVQHVHGSVLAFIRTSEHAKVRHAHSLLQPMLTRHVTDNTSHPLLHNGCIIFQPACPSHARRGRRRPSPSARHHERLVVQHIRHPVVGIDARHGVVEQRQWITVTMQSIIKPIKVFPPSVDHFFPSAPQPIHNVQQQQHHHH